MASVGVTPTPFAIANTSARPATSTNSMRIAEQLVTDAARSGSRAQIPDLARHPRRARPPGLARISLAGPETSISPFDLAAHLRRHEHRRVNEADALLFNTSHTRSRSSPRGDVVE